MEMTQGKLNEILKRHKFWLDGSAEGMRADLRCADLRGADLDYSCLPLWCGGQFKADERICKQIFAHALRIAELSGVGNKTLHKAVGRFVKGWHRERDFLK